MAVSKRFKIGCLTVLSYIGVAVITVTLGLLGILTGPETLLMLVMFFGLYVGFGILIVAYRFVTRLDEMDRLDQRRFEVMVDEQRREQEPKVED